MTITIRLLLLSALAVSATGCSFRRTRLNVVPAPELSNSTWTINDPGVQTRLTPYPEIAFKDGDLVTVAAAGGCVHTGGSGKTWKDYVNPRGANSAKFYHGLIWIPGATIDGRVVPVGTGLVRISSIVDKSFVIRRNSLAESELYVRLGYEDDEYDDNDYKHFDNGNPSQCKKDGKGNPETTYVKIQIQQAKGTSSTVNDLRPFDVVATDTDANGLMVSPYWHFQDPFLHNGTLVREVSKVGVHADFLPDAEKLCASFPGNTSGFSSCHCPRNDRPCSCGGANPSCTSQEPSFDYPVPISLQEIGISRRVKDCPVSGSGNLDGHANWIPISARGYLTWSHDQPFDEDADIFLTKPGPSGSCDFAGYTSAWQDQIEVEAAEYETFDSFWTGGWYQIFQNHATLERLSQDAIVIGLWSLDCVHGCKTEIHPAYGIAARIKKSPEYKNGVWDDYWAVFARNFGNEGWCSHDDHPLDLSRLVFDLPAPPGATSFKVIADDKNYVDIKHPDKTPPDPTDESTEFKANVQGVLVGAPELVGNAARIGFVFPNDKPRTRINGFLHLQWSGPDSSPLLDKSDPVGQNDCGGSQRKHLPEGTGSGRRSNQAGDFEKVKVISMSELMKQPLSNPSRPTALRTDSSQKRTVKEHERRLQMHCPKGQICTEEGNTAPLSSR